jgi:glycosyltransferase involved in cell wall biosynthesis
MNTHVDISIVLPVYNQADHIATIAADYLATLENLKQSVELILVVNGNNDGSLECCRDLESKYEQVKVLDLKRPGWGRAVRAGLEAASGNVLCYTNSARTSTYCLALHIMLAVAHPDLVIKANRRLRYPLMRRLGSVLYNAQCRNLFDLAVWDVNGTPKAFSRATYDQLDLKEDGDLIDVELLIRCKFLGRQILEVPVVTEVRHGGESTTNIGSALKMYSGAFRMWRHWKDGACRGEDAACHDL